MIICEWLTYDALSLMDVMDINEILDQIGHSHSISIEEVKAISEKSLLFIAREDAKENERRDRIKGVGIFTIVPTFTGKIGYLGTILIHQSARTQGVREELVRFLIKQLQAAKVNRLVASCGDDNSLGEKAYLDLGFIQGGKCYVLDL